jgi:hypothetical protein
MAGRPGRCRRGPSTLTAIVWALTMWLISDINAADINDPQPGTGIAGRIEVDHLGAPFKLGAMLVMQVLEPAAQVSIGTLYIFDDGSDVAIVRLQGESPDLWVVDRFWLGADGCRERQSRFNNHSSNRPGQRRGFSLRRSNAPNAR